jgi:ATP-dependent Clp protease ATP-binding subunit ClpA
MFERFTDRARQVLVRARDESRELGHNFIGTEHLLLGLVAGEGVAARVLAARGVSADGVRARVVAIVGTAPGGAAVDDAVALASIGIDLDEVTAAVEETFGEGALDRAAGGRRSKRTMPWSGPPFAPRVKKVLELSLREALAMKHGYIGTEHLLLAILREGQGVAAQILAEQVDLQALRADVLDELRSLRPGA